MEKQHSFVIIILMLFLRIPVDGLSQSAPLFESDEILELTLKADLKTVFKDRGEDPDYHPATIHFQQDQQSFDIPVRIKARGNFRKMRQNCKYPPLFLNFAKSTTPQTSIFSDQDKTKLVTPCRGEEYVIHEYLVYKLYNLITPRSFRARLVRIIYEDTVKEKRTDPLFGILLEEEEQMAERNNMQSFELEGLRPKGTKTEEFLKMAVFQYMIGNTDWSVQYQQNIKLIYNESVKLPITVPYDFDHAGIVRAPYAKPAPELKMSSTLERRYRGYCMSDMNSFDEVFELFNTLKPEFYALYQGNSLLDEKYIDRTVKFLDEFYEIINDPDKAEKAFMYPCESATSNIVIKGLQK